VLSLRITPPDALEVDVEPMPTVKDPDELNV
jgi:hypothetical protein